MWDFVLKYIYQVLNVLKHFHENVEREKGRKLICVRYDNGGGYKGPFEEYFKEHKIKIENSVPNMTQYN